jgi:Ca2+-binding RTX toxin-like protein
MATIIGNNNPNSLTGTNFSDVLSGLGGDDVLRGRGGNDELLGGAGNDLLDGGAGADDMMGGSGNDTYVVNSSQDHLFETGGTDTVRSAISYTLADGFENLTLTGSALRAIGNKHDNVLTGNSHNNVLNGRAGADTMIGKAGNDLYFIDDKNDRIVEHANQGTDRVVSALSVKLGTYFDGVQIENVTLTGDWNVAILGNALDNVLIGNGGNNSIHGLAGDDTLIGGAGNDKLAGAGGRDVMRGGFGADTFEFFAGSDAATRPDVILDFSRSQGDRIVLNADADTALDGDQAFSFGGFDTTPESGELSLVAARGYTLVRCNTDADAAVEIAFRVFGTVPNRASDFDL